MKRFLLLLLLLLLVAPVSADYALQVQALTNSPADGATTYLGNLPAAPLATTTETFSIRIPTSGTINIAEIYDYSGTAGTAEAYSYYLRLNNATDYLINTTAVAANGRVFTNQSMGVVVAAGDTFEIKRVHPTWATNPLTNIVGGYVVVNTSFGSPGYALHAMALTHSNTDSATVYFGGRPIAPATTQGTNKIYLPTNGTITNVSIDTNSGTAGTGEAWPHYLDVNLTGLGGSGGTQNLVSALASTAGHRMFENTSLSLPVTTADYIEFRKVNPAWVTNPATTIIGATAFVDTRNEPIIDGYPLWVEAITSSPADSKTVYFGNRPIIPSETPETNKIYIRQAGEINRANIYVYSGTAGGADAWSLYVRKNNATDYLIETVAEAASERIFNNESMAIPVVAGDFIEIKGVQPAWASNPATTIYGGYVFLEYDTGSLPVPDFTSDVTSGTSPLTVTFTDASVLDPTAWEWSWYNTDNSTTSIFAANSTDQNPVATFDAGHFQIYLNVTNASGYRTSTKDYVIASTPSGGYEGYTQQDIWMDPTYTLTLNVKNSDGAPISGATILTSDGQNTTTDALGVGTLLFDYEVAVGWVTMTGYTTASWSYVMDEDREETVTLYAASGATELSGDIGITGTPKDVRFHVTTFFGEPIPEATMYAQGISTTTGSFDWVASLFSIDFNETPIQNTSMYDNTDSNGDIVFLSRRKNT